MDIKAKILPEYFEQIKAGIKYTEWRQFENFILVNSETGEELTVEINDIHRLGGFEDNATRESYPNVPWLKDKPIHQINLFNRGFCTEQKSRKEKKK